MTQTPRERARAQTMAEILSIGRAQLAEHGAAGLSMRAVARELGVVSSAVYRYVASRDELLTLLLVDGYNALGDTVDQAVDSVPSDDFSAQWRALGRAVREWGLAEPARYGLLFGAPVPGYEAPAAQTTEPGTRVVLRLVRLIEDAYKAGVLDDQMPGQTPGQTPGRRPGQAPAQAPAANFAAVREELALEVPDAVLARGILVWTALFGAVNFEVFGQYGAATFADPAALFELHLDSLAHILGLRHPGTR
ncbi:TetR/AcrR family transcriptional regulator [Arthrobacter sp. H35-D1]|uniref:TetR/AcrR family transcriptional regulator n=1 Tax=Arthrobacter sp. H35-D1 TaxID=3046202 RepID=UPI0024BAACD2|nr:TetR/AcrR family transcriptional regulator [Arthrobacter sp. H35-D1]MDJ0315411.1 TetR/AcrR family transcriptional regulator [Arthrobacter sp. H35-D1]